MLVMYIDCFWFYWFFWGSVLSVGFFPVVFRLDFFFSFPVFSSVGGICFFPCFCFVFCSLVFFFWCCVCLRSWFFWLLSAAGFCFIFFWCFVCMRSWFLWLLSAAGLDGASVAAFWLCFCGCLVLWSSAVLVVGWSSSVRVVLCLVNIRTLR